jgi:ATP-dependent DNA ligase
MFMDRGYEGIITRNLYSPYKHGRSTKKEQYLCKIKKYQEVECKLVGVSQYQENLSESFLNMLSYKEKHQYKENMRMHDKVGSLVLEHPVHGKIYVGTGLTDKLRKRVWEYYDQFVGKMVKIKYWGVTPNGKLRFPSFVGFRDITID